VVLPSREGRRSWLRLWILCPWTLELGIESIFREEEPRQIDNPALLAKETLEGQGHLPDKLRHLTLTIFRSTVVRMDDVRLYS
jgi:hypothetical protein